jgi:hypothetical protein
LKEIGGYFELELADRGIFHDGALRLNTGRNAYAYILLANKFESVYLPFYTCEVMIATTKALGVDIKFYNIDSQFKPLFDFYKIKDDEAFVYTNYFGLLDDYVLEISRNCKNLIIDNAQALYANPIQGVNSFNSARKFLGVPDGAYLYTNMRNYQNLEQDVSYSRFEHLLCRHELGANKSYLAYQENEHGLANTTIKLMSQLTSKILNSVNHEAVANTRRQNYMYLNSQLKQYNNIDIELIGSGVPLVYPFWIENGKDLREYLIVNKVFTAVYWKGVRDYTCELNGFENSFSEHAVFLPIDQRYNSNDMDVILNLIRNYGV